MAYKSLWEFIRVLEDNGELIRIKEFISPDLEITEITDRISKNNGTALLFENNGTDYPILINAFGSLRRMALALSIENLEMPGKEIETLLSDLSSPANSISEKLNKLLTLKKLSEYFPKVIKKKGKCQQVIIQNPDMTKLPVLKCWPFDGGRFITLPVVHTIDPENGIRNVGMYRMQVFSKDTTGMHWHIHKGSATHLRKYKALNQKMPVTVTLGGDPAYTYAATAPLPENLDEYVFAGFLRKQRVNLVKCLTNEIFVPEDVDFVIEGYVDPEEDLICEGPFGDHTGFYSLQDFYPIFHVSCITHRKNPVYPATIVGIPPQEDAYIGKATERIFLDPIKLTLAPEVIDINIPAEGVFHNLVIVKIRNTYPGQAFKVIFSLWGAGQMMFTKMIVVVDEEVNIFDNISIAKVISENCNPLEDIIFSKGPLDVLDHTSDKFAFGSKMGIDATNKYKTNKIDYIPTLDKAKILETFKEIKSINDNFIKQGISFAIISLTKSRKNQIKELAEKLIENEYIKGLKTILFIDLEIDIFNLRDVIWWFSNNFDPIRDTYKLKSKYDLSYNGIAIDGSRKTKTLDSLSRPCPNSITMDDKTIEKIDKIWDILGLGKLIESPSLKYNFYPGQRAEIVE